MARMPSSTDRSVSSRASPRSSTKSMLAPVIGGVCNASGLSLMSASLNASVRGTR
jgi:hypothetical protein